VSLHKKLLAFYGIAIIHHMVDNIMVKGTILKCFNPNYIGQYYSKMLMFMQDCDKCQRTRRISRRHEMPLQAILEVEVFDCWWIDFMGLIPSSFGNEYILVVVDYVSKWVEATSCKKNDAKRVIKFLEETNLCSVQSS